MEVVSLSLRARARVATDKDIARLFVEYSILDLPSVETPLSLPKPLPGQSIHFNYSNGREKSQHREIHWLNAVHSSCLGADHGPTEV